MKQIKTNIYIVRHAEPDRSIHDDTLRPLTAKGEADTAKVTAYLQDKNICAVYSSPFKRAYDTVKPFADAAGLPVVIVANFRERKVDSTWVEDFKAFSRRQWEDFNYKLTDGESLAEVQRRNVAALFTVLKENSGRNIAIGSHGTALSAILNYFNPLFGYDDFWAFADKMPYIVRLQFEGNKLAAAESFDLSL